MAKPAPSILTEEMPIDAACASGVAALWADYMTARAAAGDLAQLRRMMPLAVLSADEERRLAACGEARAALNAWLAGGVEQGEIELWARSGSRIEDPRRIPASAVCVLKFDYEKRTASGEGLPLLYDVCVRPVATATDSAQWARATVRRLLRDKDKIPKRPTKAAWGRLLAAEMEKDVKAGRIRSALTADYLEDQLKPWGIWPLDSFK